MIIKEIIQAIEAVAPRPLQESYDNSGFQVGNDLASIESALVCIDVTESVIDEAIALNIPLVISHHPLIFKGIKSLTGKDYIERVIIKAIKHNIAIYAAHTNLDNAWHGVNSRIAKKLELKNTTILDGKPGMLLKLVVFVPIPYIDTVRTALFEAGAGNIGNYDACSFNSEGIGTFRASEKAQPFVGKQGELHAEPEYRVEVIFPVYLKDNVLAALHQSHPYEQVAYDLIPIINVNEYAGSGFVGELENPMDEMDFLKSIKQKFHCGCIKHSALLGKKIKRVAVCGGSASFLIPQAIAADADIFLTGEIKYHEFFGPNEKILLADLGHYESEQFTMELIASIIKEKYPAFEIHFTKVNTNPINYL